MELFGDWIKQDWMGNIFNCISDSLGRQDGHTFIFLTKRPENLIKWSPFPDNCWVGVSLTGREDPGYAYPLTRIKATVKFLSIEPLLSPVKIGNNGYTNSLENAGIGWLIIGQQTPVKKSTQPKIEWIKEIVDAADRAGIPVFLKENLESLFDVDGKPYKRIYPAWANNGKSLRQEFPIMTPIAGNKVR